MILSSSAPWPSARIRSVVALTTQVALSLATGGATPTGTISASIYSEVASDIADDNIEDGERRTASAKAALGSSDEESPCTEEDDDASGWLRTFFTDFLPLETVRATKAMMGLTQTLASEQGLSEDQTISNSPSVPDASCYPASDHLPIAFDLLTPTSPKQSDCSGEVGVSRSDDPCYFGLTLNLLLQRSVDHPSSPVIFAPNSASVQRRFLLARHGREGLAAAVEAKKQRLREEENRREELKDMANDDLQALLNARMRGTTGEKNGVGTAAAPEGRRSTAVARLPTSGASAAPTRVAAPKTAPDEEGGGRRTSRLGTTASIRPGAGEDAPAAGGAMRAAASADVVCPTSLLSSTTGPWLPTTAEAAPDDEDRLLRPAAVTAQLQRVVDHVKTGELLLLATQETDVGMREGLLGEFAKQKVFGYTATSGREGFVPGGAQGEKSAPVPKNFKSSTEMRSCGDHVATSLRKRAATNQTLFRETGGPHWFHVHSADGGRGTALFVRPDRARIVSAEALYLSAPKQTWKGDNKHSKEVRDGGADRKKTRGRLEVLTSSPSGGGENDYFSPAILAEVEVAGAHRVIVLNLHLPGGPGDRDEYFDGMQVLLERAFQQASVSLSETGCSEPPVILTGDFNCGPDQLVKMIEGPGRKDSVERDGADRSDQDDPTGKGAAGAGGGDQDDPATGKGAAGGGGGDQDDPTGGAPYRVVSALNGLNLKIAKAHHRLGREKELGGRNQRLSSFIFGGHDQLAKKYGPTLPELYDDVTLGVNKEGTPLTAEDRLRLWDNEFQGKHYMKHVDFAFRVTRGD